MFIMVAAVSLVYVVLFKWRTWCRIFAFMACMYANVARRFNGKAEQSGLPFVEPPRAGEVVAEIPPWIPWTVIRRTSSGIQSRDLGVG